MPSASPLASARFALRAGHLALRAGTAIGGYELRRAVARRPGLEAEAKRSLGRAVLRGLGVDLRIVGALPQTKRARLVVANHRSALDIAMLLAEVDDAILLSRADLAEWPVLGRLATHGETVFVDRSDRANGARAIRSMRKVLERHRTLCVFPEGTTHADPFVRPFQAGAFVAARGLDVELVPVGIAYASGLEFTQKTMGAHLTNVMRARRIRAAMVVGEPMALHGRRSETLARDTHAAVQALFERATTMVAR